MNPPMTLGAAILLAFEAHAGQTDRGGKPYFAHLMRVMDEVESEEAKIVAVLHDILEDTPVTVEELERAGADKNIIAAIQVLTKPRWTTKEDNAREIRKNPLALEVKLADNLDNLDVSRIPNPTPEDMARFHKYVKVRAILEGDVA